MSDLFCCFFSCCIFVCLCVFRCVDCTMSVSFLLMEDGAAGDDDGCNDIIM